MMPYVRYSIYISWLFYSGGNLAVGTTEGRYTLSQQKGEQFHSIGTIDRRKQFQKDKELHWETEVILNEGFFWYRNSGYPPLAV